jgi:hypothetical protein
MRQKLAQFGVQTIGHVVTAGVVVFLVLAWMLTSPFVQLGDRLAGHGKIKAKARGKILNEEIGEL